MKSTVSLLHSPLIYVYIGRNKNREDFNIFFCEDKNKSETTECDINEAD